MLIIFDLDDTLVDTSGCLTPPKLEEALRSMIAAGFEVSNFQEALNSLQECNRVAENAQEAIKNFLGPAHQNSLFLEIGTQVMYGSDLPDVPLTPLEGAHEVLSTLASSHQIALVTIGQTVQQMNKLKKAGIDSTLFSKIIVSGKKSKKEHYQVLVEELKYPAHQVWVCGDRIKVDLLPAADLGFWTVQMRWGRGLYSEGSIGCVHYCISSLRQLLTIICEPN